MARTITVVTPENITITYQAAGIASRFMAVVVDLMIQITTAILVLVGIQQIVGKDNQGGVGPGSLLTSAGIVFVSLLLPFAYSILFEMIWSGRTPGKVLFRLRTVREGGYPLDLLSSIVRNLLRIIDVGVIVLPTPLLLCGLPGLVCMFFSPTYKRIGDYAAGTIVIVENEALRSDNSVEKPGKETTGKETTGRFRRKMRATQPQVPTTTYEVYLPYVRNLDRVTSEDYQLLRRFVARRRSLDLMVQAGLAERVARPLIAKLEIEPPIYYQLQYADLLQAIELRYAEDRKIVRHINRAHTS